MGLSPEIAGDVVGELFEATRSAEATRQFMQDVAVRAVQAAAQEEVDSQAAEAEHQQKLVDRRTRLIEGKIRGALQQTEETGEPVYGISAYFEDNIKPGTMSDDELNQRLLSSGNATNLVMQDFRGRGYEVEGPFIEKRRSKKIPETEPENLVRTTVHISW